MKQLSKSILCFHLFLGIFGAVLSVPAFAATTVTATVDRNALNPEDTLTLTVSVESQEEVSVGQPTLPPLNDFEVLNEWTSQSQQASMVSSPSGPQFKKTYASHFNFMLQPKHQGSLSIGAVEVVINGQSFNTKPIAIKVAKGAGLQARPKAGAPPGAGGAIPPPDLFEDEEDDLFSQLLRRTQPPAAGSRTLPINPQDAFFIQVDTDKTEAYAGEQVTVSFYLYTRGLIRDLDTLKYPTLKGFWKEDIELATRLNFQSEVVNGIPFKKALLASFALFPLKEGVATIDPYEAKCTVLLPDSFGGFGTGKAYEYTKVSQPVKITVRALPTEGRPANFSGAVGDFQVTSRIEDRNIIEGQPFALRLRFEGRGNGKLIDLPAFQPPDGIEINDTQNEARFFRTGTSFKEFKIMMIPRHEGDFTIAPFSVSIFDPQKKVYVTKTTEALQIHVGKGMPGNKDQPVAMPEDMTPEQLAKMKDENAEPHLLTIDPGSSKGTVSRGAKNLLWGLVFLSIFSVLIWRARQEMGWGQKKKDLMRSLELRLRKVESSAQNGDWRGVGTAMTNTVYFVLGEISGEGGANVELGKLLLKAPPSVRRELAEPLLKQMETFQMLTFAPETVVGALKDPATLKKHIDEMKKLMEKAVSLGLSSEQSAESAPDPKAS